MKRRFSVRMCSALLVLVLLSTFAACNYANANSAIGSIASTTGQGSSQAPAVSSKPEVSSQAPAVSSKPEASSQAPAVSSKPEASSQAPAVDLTPALPELTVKVKTTPITIKNYYGRTWLAQQANGKALVWMYDRLAEAVFYMEPEVDVYNTPYRLTQAEFLTVNECFTADFAQYFWLDRFVMVYDTNNVIHQIKPQYKMTAAQKETAVAAFTAAAEAMLSGITDSMSAYEREKTIHDRLVLHCTYQSSEYMHTAYGALVDGKAVCDGYAKAFQYLCHLAGLPTITVTGTALATGKTTPEAHAWSMVQIDGKYYCTDVTWDDTGEPTADRLRYAYFNLTAAQINEDHTAKAMSLPLPVATATEANYFVRNGLIADALTVDGVAALIQQSESGRSCRMWLKNTEDVRTWMQKNALAIAVKIGITGAFSYNWNLLGHELQITFAES